MRKLLLLAPVVFLAACVDTTGLTSTIHTEMDPLTSSNAVVTVTEYADLQCPACRAAFETLTKPIIAKYGKQISFDFRHFPLSSIHQYAMEAAEASECAGDQGKFWEFIDYDYAHQADLSSKTLRTWATELKLDEKLFDRCVKSHVKRKAIQASYDEGIKRGVQGTPTFYVNGTQATATIEDLSAAIDAAIAQGAVLR